MRKDVLDNVSDALLSLLLEGNEDLSKAKESLSSAVSSFSSKEGDGLLKALSSYSLPKERRRALLEETLLKGEKGTLRAFYEYLFDKRLLSSLPEINKRFVTKANAILGLEEGIAESAKPLTSEELSSLEKALSHKRGKKVTLHNRVDPSLIGGVRCLVGDDMYDSSLLGRLEGLRLSLLKGERP